jgi:hypothetical protein
MISANDANNRPAQTEIKLTASDIREIKGYANKEYMSAVMPSELDAPEFLVLCYARATDRVLNKKGININIVFEGKLPYETVD